MTFKDRLKQAMEDKGFTQASLAKEAGLAQSMVWKLVTGNASGTSKLVALSKALGVRPEWLGDGSGPMTDDKNQELSTPSFDPSFSVSIYENDLKTDRLLHVPEIIKSDSCKAYHVTEDTGCQEVPAGTYIVVDSSEKPGNNDLVFARVGKSTSVYRFVKGGVDDFLSIDDKRVPLVPVTSSEVKGVIVFLIRGLRRG